MFPKGNLLRERSFARLIIPPILLLLCIWVATFDDSGARSAVAQSDTTQSAIEQSDTPDATFTPSSTPTATPTPTRVPMLYGSAPDAPDSELQAIVNDVVGDLGGTWG